MQSIVGEKTYSVWLEMLRELVPYSRTHRLAPMIAGMLQYAYSLAEEKYGDAPEEGSVADVLLNAPEYFDPESAYELVQIIEGLFEDAGVEYQRYNSRGDGYSIAENALYEYIHWYDMPWRPDKMVMGLKNRSLISASASR